MSTKSRALAGIALTMCLILVGCGASSSDTDSTAVAGTWDEVVDAATQEGQVNLYTGMPENQTARLLEAFTEEYPNIDVVATRGFGELYARASAEIDSDADGLDVAMFPGAREWFEDHADDIATIAGPSVQDWRDDYWVDEDKSIVVTRFPYSILVWNSEEFPDGFSAWDDLLDPEVVDRLGIAGETTTMTPTMAAVFDFMVQELGPDFMESLGEQRPKFYPSVTPVAQATASGEIGVSYTSTPSTIQEMVDAGAPLEFALPDPGIANEAIAGAVSSAKRPHAAQVFMDFLMSPEGQEALNTDGFGDGGRAGIPGALDLRDWAVTLSAEYTPDRIDEARREFESYFRQ